MKPNSAHHTKKKRSKEGVDAHSFSARLKSIIGSVKLPEGFDEKKELEKHYQSKHF